MSSHTTDTAVGRRTVRPRLVSLVVRPTAPPPSVGLAIAALLIVAETLVLYPLKVFAPESALGVVYLLGVVVVAIVWGFRLAAAPKRC